MTRGHEKKNLFRPAATRVRCKFETREQRRKNYATLFLRTRSLLWSSVVWFYSLLSSGKSCTSVYMCNLIGTLLDDADLHFLRIRPFRNAESYLTENVRVTVIASCGGWNRPAEQIIERWYVFVFNCLAGARTQRNVGDGWPRT